MNEREIAMACAQIGRRQVLKAFAGAVGGVALGAYVRPSEAQTTAGSAGAVPNELVISLPSGSQTNYPLQFGRAFPKGAIPGLPAVALDGVPLALQQVDVKTLHDDCSVKFAVISVVIPWLDMRKRVLSITNRAVGAKPAAETVANMLARYDFDARIGLMVGGRPLAGAPISARAMLSALTDARLAAETAISGGGVNSRYWTVGPVCTTVLLCDHTTKAYDVGTNATKAIRPMFHVQFWPSLGRYKVRHIIEQSDCTKLKDELGLEVVFTTGLSAPETKLAQTGVNLYSSTFQSRAFWAGEAIPRANVQHGMAYLSSTGVIPNYDPTIPMREPALKSWKSNWATRPKTIGSAGYMKKAMPATGGRPDFGLLPKWDLIALKTGDATMLEIAEKHSEFAGSFGFYFREGSDSKTIFGGTPGKGRILSKSSRPKLRIFDGNAKMTIGGVDGVTVDGKLAASTDGFDHDSAHCPCFFWFSYLTTGEAIWHEKLIQVSAWSFFLVNPGLGYNSVANGRDASDMILNGIQSRGWAWMFRHRARAWWAALDNSPEKELTEKALIDALAQRAGLYDIDMLRGHPVREAWNDNHAKWYENDLSRPNGLHNWSAGGGYSSPDNYGGDVPDNMGGGQAGWMRNYITMAAYHGVELGFDAAKPLAEWVALQTILIANSPEPLHLGDYSFPSNKADGSYFQNLDEILNTWDYLGNATFTSSGGFPGAGDTNTYGVSAESYSSVAAAAIAMSNGFPGQIEAWAYNAPHHQATTTYEMDPRFSIIPRT